MCLAYGCCVFLVLGVLQSYPWMDASITLMASLLHRTIMAQFQARSDNQITTLEVLAIAVGLSSFSDLLSGRRVAIFSDNRGAEGTVIKGISQACDQCMLIHEIWTLVQCFAL